MTSEGLRDQSCIERAREAARETFNEPVYSSGSDAAIAAADAAVRMVLEHLRARYLDEAMEDVPMIDFIEPLLAELKP